MGLIGKIRNNYWIIFVMIALALASFIIMDVMGSNQNASSLFGGRGTTIGEVAGQKIEQAEFDRVERALYSGSQDPYTSKNALWTYLVEKNLVEKQAKCLGVGVSKEELMDLQFGNNISPIIQNNFRDPQTGQVNRNTLMQYKQAIESGTINGEPLSNDFRAFWAEQEKQIIKTKVQDKISTMVAKGLYIPKWQAEVINQLNTEKVDFNFVKIPFDAIPDAEVKLTDEDYAKYLSENKGKHTNTDETRMLELFILDVKATTQDSTNIRNEFDKTVTQFKVEKNDSLFAATHGGALAPIFNKMDDLTGALKDNIKSLGVGQVFGPYIEEGRYIAAKLVDKQVIADSVKARHILKKAENPAQLASAQKAIDSLKALIVSGKSRFDSLAIRNSDDPGSGFKGGDLGYFAQGAMVPSFNDACFYGSKEGGLYTVTTNFGVHLIEVLKKKYNNQEPKYKLAMISSPIVPSQETQDKLFEKAQKLIATNKTAENLKAAASKDTDFRIEMSKPFKENDYIVGTFPQGQTSRSIVQWAYKSDKGDVSPAVYTYTNPQLYYNSNYVLTSLNAVNPAGLLSVDAAKTSLESQVKNAKRAELIKAKIKGTDLSAIASQFAGIVDTASGINFNSGFIPKIQSAEPLVTAKAFSLAKDGIAGPITGSSGVFMIKLLEKQAPLPADPMMAKQSGIAQLRGSASYRVWDALKKTHKPKDNRSKFF